MQMRSACLNESLQSPLDSKTKYDIATRLFSCDEQNKLNRLDPYFQYYTHQSDIALHDYGRYNYARTHLDIVEIASRLQSGQSKQDVKEYLISSVSPPADNTKEGHEIFDAAINLAVRLLLMTEVGTIARFGFSGHRTLQWEQGSLKDFIIHHFESPQALASERVKLERTFIARNLTRIGGIRIVWTANLADHLCMYDHDTAVAIFHHASYLEVMKGSPMFPAGFVEETLRTLALLLPQADVDTRKYFRKLAEAEKLDITANQCGTLRTEGRQIDEFRFWRDRIVILKQVFDESEPNSWGQWYYDKRRGAQRFPFLLAAAALALTAFFGLIQCLEGALQVYKAYHPVDADR